MKGKNKTMRYRSITINNKPGAKDKLEKLYPWLATATFKNAEIRVENEMLFWEGGTWEYGTWKSGTWYCGIWEYGLWEDGTWHDGIWYDGIWEKGMWKSGIWHDGTWESGTWYGGTWNSGWKTIGQCECIVSYSTTTDEIQIDDQIKTIVEWDEWFSRRKNCYKLELSYKLAKFAQKEERELNV